MLATSKNVLFPGHNHLLTTGTDDISLTGTQAIIKVSGHKYQWLAGGYDLEIGYFKKWLAWWLPGGYWIVAFLRSDKIPTPSVHHGSNFPNHTQWTRNSM